MKLNALSVFALTCALVSTAFAGAPSGPTTVPPLNHVFVIVMENHGYYEILNNPNAPFINGYVKTANLATNYFAVAHPSLTNYLEMVGGSNFGVLDDNPPDWHDLTCQPNLATGLPNTVGDLAPICPITGFGTDAATPAIDFTNEASGPPGVINIDGVQSIKANPNTIASSIADQLAASGHTWKSYQEDAPFQGVDQVNFSDGVYSNLTNFNNLTPAQTPPLTTSQVLQLYAVKHNPFVYFKSVQQGVGPLSMREIAGFDGPTGLWADLATGSVASYSFIAPNECDDHHGQAGSAGPYCAYDPKDNGTQAGLNPALIYQGDVMVQKIVNGIHSSPAWKSGHAAIVVVWDENDTASAPETNQVVLIVDTNYGPHGVKSAKSYNHFSLLHTIESAFGLNCLNNACNAAVMSDLFASY